MTKLPGIESKKDAQISLALELDKLVRTCSEGERQVRYRSKKAAQISLALELDKLVRTCSEGERQVLYQ
jgi:hypothetical protein